MWEDLSFEISRNLDRLGRTLVEWAGNHLFNIVVIMFGAYILRHFGVTVITQVIQRTVRGDLFPTETDRKKRVQTLNSLINATLRVAVWIIAAIMIIDELGIDTAPLLASASVLGLGLAFGAQSLIKDFVSGVSIITENQYRVGDTVQLGTVSGIVEAITIRTTILRDFDGHLHHVPNGTIAITTNKTIGYGNINEDLIVNFDTDLEQLEHVVQHVGEEVAAMAEFKDKVIEPPRVAMLKGFHENGLVVNITGRTAPSEQWNVRSEMYRKLKKAFEKHKIKVITNQQIALHHATHEVTK